MTPVHEAHLDEEIVLKVFIGAVSLLLRKRGANDSEAMNLCDIIYGVLGEMEAG